jgi:hypothetical protein
MREKAWSTPKVTVHRRLEICHLGMQFVHNWLRKRPYALSRSCKWSRDLQLSYYSLGPLMCQNREKNSIEQCYFTLWGTRTHRDPVRSRRRARPVGPPPYRAVPHAEAGPRPVDQVQLGDPCARRGMGPWSVPRGAFPLASASHRLSSLAAVHPHVTAHTLVVLAYVVTLPMIGRCITASPARAVYKRVTAVPSLRDAEPPHHPCRRHLCPG